MSKAEAERVAAVGYIAFMKLTRMMFISRVGGGATGHTSPWYQQQHQQQQV